MNISMSNVEFFHIGYSDETIKDLPVGFKLLDNSSNERPDWYEYWAIRKYFEEHKLVDDNKYIGFFSPKFHLKTGHDYETLTKEITNTDQQIDVLCICPQPEVGSFFKNIYFGSDFFDPGSLKVIQDIFHIIDPEFQLDSFITDSSNTIFSNYFIAKRNFWEKWIEICEIIFMHSEKNFSNAKIHEELNKLSTYGGKSTRKIFVIEGIASYIVQKNNYSIKSIPLVEGKYLENVFSKYKKEALICDKLKIIYTKTNDRNYIDLFQKISQKVLTQLIYENSNREKLKMKQTPAHDRYNDTIFSLIREINPNSVVEIGCMRGTLAEAYKQINPECIWHGIDIDEDNIMHAKRICDDAVIADVEKLSISDFAKYEHSDAWIFGDVLEHLYNPWELLKKIRVNAKSDFTVIACIPNSQHWNFQARVNSGLMHYENDGLFDRTHIRFFSRITMIDLFQQSGYFIEKIISRNISFPGIELYMPHIRAMAKVSGVDPDQAERDASAFQYVICAKPIK